MSEYYLTRNDELYHHGIKGQKWGLRRFQNEDGSLTTAGREHYGYGQDRADRAKSEAVTAHKIANAYTNAMDKKAAKRQAQADKKTNPFTRYNAQLRADRAKEEAKQAHKIADAYTGAMDKKAEKRQAQADYYKTPEGQKELKARQEKMKKAAIAGAAIVGTALVAYGAYKVTKGISANKKYKAALEVGKKYYGKMNDKALSNFVKIDTEVGNHYRNSTKNFVNSWQESNKQKAEDYQALAKAHRKIADDLEPQRKKALEEWSKASTVYKRYRNK